MHKKWHPQICHTPTIDFIPAGDYFFDDGNIRMTQYYAHSANKAGSPWEPLKEHCRCVAERAGHYAGVFDAKQEAIIAGLWHDLGKYSDLTTVRLKFQKVL